MNIEDLFEASFRGAIFLVQSTTTAGGRKIAKKQIVDSDLIVQEDLGLLNETHTISGTLATIRGSDGSITKSYEDMRRELLIALRKKGPGVLSHPFFGIVPNIVAISWTLDQRISALGDATISIVFEPSTGTGIPLRGKAVVSDVLLKNFEVQTQVSEDITTNVDPSPKFIGNFQNLSIKALSVFDRVSEASRVASIPTSKLNAFSNNIQKASAQITSLVNTPQSLADAIVGACLSLNGLYQSVTETFNVFSSMFDFGDGDAGFAVTTAGLAARALNNSTLNSSVQALSLGFAYQSAALDTYATVEDVDVRNSVLENQFQKMYADINISNDVLEALQELRTSTQAVLDDQKLTARQITTVVTLPTSTALLAFKYYGSSDFGVSIAELNGFAKSDQISGTVKILTV